MGTPRELLTESGSLAQANRLSSWGSGSGWRRQAANDENVSCNLRFAGQYADEESGLHYNRHRYYDSETGQYLSPDSIGLAGGVNPYGYVHNPLSWVDPLGLMPWAWNPDGMGHHLIPRNKASSIGLSDLGTMRNTPTFFPDPYNPGMHEQLHQAIKGDIGKIQGPWSGTAEDLFNAISRNLDSVSYIRGDLRIPATGEILAQNVTPKEAHGKLLEWFNKKNSGGGCG